MYNTASVACYSFDDVSALLIRELLLCPRETPIDTARLAKVTETTQDQVEAFLQESLMPLGLIHDHVFSDEEWQQYRQDTPPCLATLGYQPEDDYKSSLAEELQIFLRLELTYACSERCLHCFNEGAARSDLHEEHRLKPDMLTLDDYKRIIDEAVALGIPDVIVTGGDPFSHPDCWAILDYLQAKNLAVSLFTNAQALNTSEKIRRVARLGLKLLSVSIYSADAAIHDKITRRPGSWEQSIHVLKELTRWPVPLSIKVPVFRLNSQSYYDVRQIAHSMNAGIELSGILIPGADGDVSIVEQLQTQPEALPFLLMDPLLNNRVPMDGQPDGYEFGLRKGFPCEANHKVTVAPNGVVRGCGSIDIVYGNLHQSSLQEVILSPQRLQVIHGDQKQMFPECGQYDYCQYCRVPCFAGETFERQADGSVVLHGFRLDPCFIARGRMEVCRQIAQGVDPLRGKTIEECLAELPEEEVPVFRKKMRG